MLITADATLRRGKPIPMEQVATEAAVACAERRACDRRAPGDRLESPPRIQGHLDWDRLLADESAEHSSESLDPETPLMIAYTSGTTGVPKGAVHVHGGFLVKIAQEVAHQVDMRPEDCLCWVTDLGWIMGPWEIVGGLAAGGRSCFSRGYPTIPRPIGSGRWSSGIRSRFWASHRR